MEDSVVQAKTRLQELRGVVNVAWEQWNAAADPTDKDFSTLDDAFSSAIDLINDFYERVFDLAVIEPADAADIARLANDLTQQAERAAATVLQRATAWYLKNIATKISRRSFLLFLPTEDIVDKHSKLKSDFSAASNQHEKNKFAPAITTYTRISTDAIDLFSRIKLRTVFHPQRRLFFISIALTIILFLISLGVTLYFNVWHTQP